jgi:hypothetical protein
LQFIHSLFFYCITTVNIAATACKLSGGGKVTLLNKVFICSNASLAHAVVHAFQVRQPEYNTFVSIPIDLIVVNSIRSVSRYREDSDAPNAAGAPARPLEIQQFL